MQQKYTLHIADLQLSVRSDASPEEVEQISGILDRKMREIYLKSHCPKTEAALLCAMEFVADRRMLQEHTEELEERCEKYDLVLESFKERCSDQAEELDRLRGENAVLRSLLTREQEAEEPEEEHVALDPISPTAFLASVAEAQTEPVVGEAAPVSAPIEQSTPVEAVEEAPKRRSRVGSMFDLLSFNETD